jgi:hypothetical protein
MTDKRCKAGRRSCEGCAGWVFTTGAAKMRIYNDLEGWEWVLFLAVPVFTLLVVGAVLLMI